MDLGLNQKRALVLGGAGGLGRAVAGALVAEGVRVAIADISEDGLASAAETLRATGGTILTLPWNLADLAAIETHIAALEDSWGGVDILVNITGGPPPTTVSGQAPKLWLDQFQAMVLSVIATTDRVLPGMKARGWGRIITCTSSGVVSPIPNLGLSNALRSSLVGWSKTLSREVARDHITANIVIPGRVATERIAFLDAARAKREGRTPEEVAAESTASIPCGRYGTPQEFADTVTFLASTRASYITGSMIRVDGGLIASI